MTRDDAFAVFEEAVVLHERMVVSPGGPWTQRLISLAERLEEALELLPDDGEEFAAGVVCLYIPFYMTGRVHEFRPLIRRARRHAVSDRTRAWCELYFARSFIDVRMVAEAVEVLESIERDEDAPELWLVRARYMCLAVYALGEVERGMEVVNDALRVARTHCMDWYVATLLIELSGFQRRLGLHELALGSIEEALYIEQVCLRNLLLETTLRLGLGVCYLETRRYEDALSHTRRALECARELGGRPQEYAALANISLIELALGDWEGALESCARAEAFFLDGQWSMGRSTLDLTRALVPILGSSRDLDPIRQVRRRSERESHIGNVRLCELVLHLLDPARPPAPERPVNFVVISPEAWEALTTGAPMPDSANALERALGGLTNHHEEGRLYITSDGSAASLDGAHWVALSRRKTGRRILSMLCDAWPGHVEAWTLYESIWPHAEIEDTSALNRLYTAIHRLRSAGLGDALEAHDEGYRLRRAPLYVNSTDDPLLP